MRARVARDLGRFVPLTATTHQVSFGGHAAYRVGASDVVGSAGSVVLWFSASCPTVAYSPRVFILSDAGVTNCIRLIAPVYPTVPYITGHFIRGGATVATVSTTALLPTPNKLHCIVVTWNASGAEVWIDGTLRWSFAGDARPLFDAAPQLMLGNNVGSGTALPGSVGGEAYLYDRKLSAGEIAAHYFDGEVPEGPTSAWGPRGWDGTTTVKLTGGAGNNGAVTMGASASREVAECAPRETAEALLFDGQTSVARGVLAPADMKVDTFTATAKIRQTRYVNTVTPFFGLNATNWYVGSTGSNGLIISTRDGSNVQATLNALNTITIGAWHHVAATVETVGSNVTLSLYVDGVRVATRTDTSGFGVIYGSEVYLGSFPLIFFPGEIEDARFYGRALSAGEVAADRDEVQSGCLHHWLGKIDQQGRIADVIGGTHLPTLTAVQENDQRPEASDSATGHLLQYGNTSAIDTARTASLSAGNNDCTFAFDYYAHDPANFSRILIQCADGGYATDGILINHFGPSLLMYAKSAAAQATHACLAFGRWARYVCVFDKTNLEMRIYRDGALVGRTTGIASWGALAANPLIKFVQPATGYPRALRNVRYSAGRAWSNAEIEADARGEEIDCTHFWPLDDLNSTTVREAKQGVHATSSVPLGQRGAGANVESPRAQNLLADSNNISTALWASSGAAITKDVPLANGETACTFLDTAANVAHWLGQNVTTENGLFTGEWIVQTIDGSAVAADVMFGLGSGSCYVRYNLHTNAMLFTSSSNPPKAYSNEPAPEFGDGWRRIRVTGQMSSGGGTSNVRIYLGSGSPYVGTGSGFRVARINAWDGYPTDTDAPVTGSAPYDVGPPDIEPRVAPGLCVAGVTATLATTGLIADAMPSYFGGESYSYAVDAFVDSTALNKYPLLVTTGALSQFGFLISGESVIIAHQVATYATAAKRVAGRFARYTAVFDRAALKVYIYIDGVFIGSTVVPFAAWTEPAAYIRFGALAGGSSGAMRNVRLNLGGAWSATEVAAEFRGDDVPTTHHWPMRETNVGTTILEVVRGSHSTAANPLRAAV
jgi:hypothetical protein